MRLREILLSDLNIYKSIYCIESAIFEKRLLSKEDQITLSELKDKYNMKKIGELIKDIRKVILKIIDSDKLFDVEVYYKLKKYENRKKIVKRPIHTASLINQIAMVSMLNILLYDYFTVDGELKYKNSDLSKLIPSNFFGNIPSEKEEELFKPWAKMYKEYTFQANETFSESFENNKYAYEITLDLKDFFPSINPLIIYDFIMKRVNILYSGEDYELISKIVFKLLNFKIINHTDLYLEYYGETIGDIRKNSIKFSKGIGQGLPQAYFFGNLCMIEVSEIFSEVFSGESFYYVDDSYIYTNDLKHNNEEKDFDEKLLELNKKLNEYCNEFEKRSKVSNKYFAINKSVSKFHEKLKYNIEVHSSNEKSQYCKISDPKNEGTIYLNALTRQASMGSFELNNIFADIEDDILSSKFSTLEEGILKQIEKVKNEKNNSNKKFRKELMNIEKKLNRLLKFFRYRTKLLNYRKEGDISEFLTFIEDELDIYNNRITASIIEKYVKLGREDILYISLFVILDRYNESTTVKVQKIKEKINRLEMQIYKKNNLKSSYINRILEEHVDNIYIYSNRYSTLKYKVKEKYGDFTGIHMDVRKNKLVEVLKTFEHNKEKLVDIVKYSNDDCSYLNQIANKSNEIYRNILNAVVSNILGGEIDDTMNVNKNNNHSICCWEFRVLNYLRSGRFNCDHVKNIYDIVQKSDSTIIDISIYEVIDIFKVYIKDPFMIDELIKIHSYTTEMWKNGSKFLYFYTLHNQEHAIELIKNIVKFIKSVDFINISIYDYFLLFNACYLHDISMVRYPDLYTFAITSDKESNYIYHEFKEKIDKCSKSKESILKKDLIELYIKIDEYFEHIVRDNHANDSGEFIRNNIDLDFIDRSLRDNIAQISEAHGYDTLEIYRRKSDGKNKNLNMKFNKILLRFADLLDISENRISFPLLKSNIRNMSRTSAFHWLSHYFIKGYEIRNDYILSDNSNEYLKPKSIEERITFIIKLNLSNYISMEKDKCKECNLNNIERGKLKLDFNNSCSRDKCNFVCRWMYVKNKYFYSELKELQDYLNRNSDSFYKTVIGVEIITNEEEYIDSDYLNRISDYIK